MCVCAPPRGLGQCLACPCVCLPEALPPSLTVSDFTSLSLIFSLPLSSGALLNLLFVRYSCSVCVCVCVCPHLGLQPFLPSSFFLSGVCGVLLCVCVLHCVCLCVFMPADHMSPRSGQGGLPPSLSHSGSLHLSAHPPSTTACGQGLFVRLSCLSSVPSPALIPPHSLPSTLTSSSCSCSQDPSLLFPVSQVMGFRLHLVGSTGASNPQRHLHPPGRAFLPFSLHLGPLRAKTGRPGAQVSSGSFCFCCPGPSVPTSCRVSLLESQSLCLLPLARPQHRVSGSLKRPPPGSSSPHSHPLLFILR